MKHKYNADKPTAAEAEASKTAAALQKRFNDMINTELRKIGVNTTRPSILNLVMASAFEPDRPIVGMLHRVFNELQVSALSPGLVRQPSHCCQPRYLRLYMRRPQFSAVSSLVLLSTSFMMAKLRRKLLTKSSIHIVAPHPSRRAPQQATGPKANPEKAGKKAGRKAKTLTNTGGMERIGTLNSETLNTLYSFEESSQKLPIFAEMIRVHGGVTNALKDSLWRFSFIEVVIGIATSVANGNITKDLCPWEASKKGKKGKKGKGPVEPPPLPRCNKLEDFATAVEQFVDAEARDVLATDGKADEVVDSVIGWFGALEKLLASRNAPRQPRGFNRGFKAAARSRLGKSNKSYLTPGLKGLPVFTTCAEDVPFDQRVFREYVSVGDHGLWYGLHRLQWL